MSGKKTDAVTIGCYSAFWGDSIAAARQFFAMDAPPDYVVADYLAEVTMGILARSKKTALGNAGDGGFVKEFVDQVYAPNAKVIAKKRIRIITNAGGLHPLALKTAIEEAAKNAGIEPPPVVAAVYGDDLLDGEHAKEFKQLLADGQVQPFAHINSGGREEDKERWPDSSKKILSINAYTGAEPIVRAIAGGAQIVVTGRAVDSALVLAPLIHEFGWSMTAYDQLASGSLAGHIVECGCHATGGNFTDWRLSANSAYGGWANMGYPIVEVFPSGDFNVTKPPKTGGLVSFGTVTEQMIYEVLDPGAYLLPDVTLDLRNVAVKQIAPDVVRVSGARGRPPPPTLKTSGVYVDGYKISCEMFIGGQEAALKAQAVGEAIHKRVSGLLQKLGQEPFRAFEIECIGAEHTYGKNARTRDSREVICRMTAHHNSKMALMVFYREVAPAATCMAPGVSGGGGRPTAAPNLGHFSALIPKEKFPSTLVVGATAPVKIGYSAPCDAVAAITPHPLPTIKVPELVPSECVTVPLIKLCYGRSGDKGDTSNIGIVGRHPDVYPFLVSQLTADSLKQFMSHYVLGDVVRYEAPGFSCVNFVCTKALGGGSLSSLRVDRWGKSYAQMVLNMEITVPLTVLRACGNVGADARL